MLSETSQTNKHKILSHFTHMCNLKNNQRKRNKVSEQFKPHKNTHWYTENRVVVTKRKEVEGKMKWIKGIYCIVDAGRDWGQEEKGKTEDDMAGWHHQLGEREFDWTPGNGDGRGDVLCDSWGCKESYMTEQLKWTELNAYFDFLFYFFRELLVIQQHVVHPPYVGILIVFLL